MTGLLAQQTGYQLLFLQLMDLIFQGEQMQLFHRSESVKLATKSAKPATSFHSFQSCSEETESLQQCQKG